ncbi:BOS complex subunit ncln [Danaus plexippus]|uniref:BOS complex subunit ncln n=1 Tax=Danaus plexippus TaxID=13037 RepID=UPI002AAF88B1|nr:BOS complex subunit ncln [Danaus plexippus]
MWLDQADGFAEIFKGYLPYYLLVVFPIFIIMSPVNPVAASHEFSVYRMQQYDLHNVPHGCRSSSFNLEGRSLSSWGTSRHCIVARLQDISVDQFVETRNKAGALVLVLPKNVTLLTDEEKEHMTLLEMAMMQQEINIPVYFANWSPEFEDIIADLQHSFITDDKSGTALEAMFNTVSSNGYQIVVSTSSPHKLESKPVTLHGKLFGRAGNTQTIVIAAHYDANSLVPELSTGADSNASGVAALLELARIFSRLYSVSSDRGGPSILFVLTSTGHSLNYFSTKKWLEEQLDSTDATLLQDVSFIMCLDSISSGPLSMHVSKPPKPWTPANSIKSRLRVPVVHKKINLADETLAWHHERFSIKRMTAFTVSSLQSHRDPSRSSILDTASEGSLNTLYTNVVEISRALASHVYNLTDEHIQTHLYDEALGVDMESIKLWYNYLSSQPRAPHIVTTSQNGGVTGALERALAKYVEVSVSVHATDRREPEHALYGPTRALLYVYSVKPAVFDLILTLAIVAYLTVLYFAMQVFPRFYEEYAKIVTGKAKVH